MSGPANLESFENVAQFERGCAERRGRTNSADREIRARPHRHLITGRLCVRKHACTISARGAELIRGAKRRIRRQRRRVEEPMMVRSSYPQGEKFRLHLGIDLPKSAFPCTNS